MQNLTNKHFTVSPAVPLRKGNKIRVYKLSDYNDKAVTGSWYQEKRQEILNNQSFIEKVFRSRTHLHSTKELFFRCNSLQEKYKLWIKKTSTMS